MKKFAFSLILFHLLSLPMAGQQADVETAAGDTLPWPQGVQLRLDSLIDCAALLETSQLGLMVYDLTADSAIYCLNHRQTMRPASTMKVITAIAAIDRLGSRYRLATSLYYTGTIANQTLTGDLYGVGGMDPAFSQSDMDDFVASLRALGVDTLRGRLVADRQFKDADLLGEGWCWDDDNPQLSPLLIGKKDVFLDRLAQTLRDAGITVEAQMTEAPLPAEATHVCTCSRSLLDILVPMLKDSNNLYAESVLYQLAAAAGNRPAKAVHARQQIQRLVQQVGLNPANYKFADGSGLSLYNYVSAELQVRLLRYAWQTVTVRSLFVPSLPIAAKDGTLAKRMTGTCAAGNVRAKTGTLTGISSLAGYCTAPNGHELCFSILNQGVLRNADGRAFQDQVCMALCTPSTQPLVAVKPKPVVRKRSVRRRR